MDRLIYKAINDIVAKGISATTKAIDIEKMIMKMIPRNVRRATPYRDIVQASHIVIKRTQAENNMCRVVSPRNFYEIKLAHPVLRNSGAQYLC